MTVPCSDEWKGEKMNNLNEVLPQIMERIKNHRSTYEQNEMAVRNQIINPILRDLGWNPESPDDIQLNMPTDEGIPDYSLIKDGKIILFIEAKNMSVDVEQKEIIRQLAKYSFNEGTKYGILTNGIVWMLIRSFEEGTKLHERIVWKTDIENEEMPKIVRKLMTISKTNIERIEDLVKKNQILDEIWQSLLNKPEEIVTGLSIVVESIISQNYSNCQFEDSEIEDLLNEKVKELISGQSDTGIPTDTTTETTLELTQGLKKMRIEGEIFEFGYNFEILVNTANWLIKKGKLKSADCPVTVGRMHNRYLINKESKHPKGNDFVVPKKLSNGLWIEAHYGTAMIKGYAKRLLEKFGISSNSLIIE
jgi:hypothetical protein